MSGTLSEGSIAPICDFLQQLQADLPCPASAAKIFRFAPTPNQPYNFGHPVPRRGALAIVTKRWGGLRWTRQRQARKMFAGRFSVSEHSAQTNGA